MGETPDVWTTLVESARQQESTTTSRSSSHRMLPLRTQAIRVHLPEKDRTPALINESLRTTIRELCRGLLPWPLFILGSVGTGKTCAALCVSDYAGGFFWQVSEFAQVVNDAMFGRLRYPNSDRPFNHSDLWKEIATANLVVLDELGGRGVVSDAQYEAVKRLVDARAGRPFIAISNLDLTGIEKLYDDRVASRIGSGTVVKVEGRDRRLGQR